MTDKTHKQDAGLTLALETAVGKGSVCLLEGTRALDYRLGLGAISKSADILELVDELLAAGGIDKRALGRVAVSEGPGSLTGIRIGLALAKGLGDALRIPLSAISLHRALAFAGRGGHSFGTALYLGRDEISRQIFGPDGQPSSAPQTIRLDRFAAEVAGREAGVDRWLTTEEAARALEEKTDLRAESGAAVEIAGPNLAALVGAAAAAKS
jgi:tRNA threonylcarbamoyladenosine biosynthesis protein TsaB